MKSVQMTYATNDEHGELPGRIRRGAVDEYEFGSAPGDGFYQESGRQGPNELPAAEFGNLEELVSLVADCSPFAREKIASLVMKKGYLRQLLDLFKTCEDLEDREGLHMMYRLVKGLVLLNDVGPSTSSCATKTSWMWWELWSTNTSGRNSRGREKTKRQKRRRKMVRKPRRRRAARGARRKRRGR